MHATYSVTAHPERDLVHITLTGFFGPADLADFDRARLAAHTRLTCRHNEHVTLVDLRGMNIQAQDILPQFRAIIADPRTRARRLAFVIGCSLVRMQLKRLIDRPDIACFAEVDEAEAWLTEPPIRYALAG